MARSARAQSAPTSSLRDRLRDRAGRSRTAWPFRACRGAGPSSDIRRGSSRPRVSSRYSNLNSSWVTMTSPSMPITSVMLVVRREPSRRRLTWTMRSTESAIWRLIASFGILMSRHHHHVFHTRQAFARAVGVERRHRAVVAGVHGRQEVETLLAANFAEDDAVGTHTQRVDDEVADGDRALALRGSAGGFRAAASAAAEAEARPRLRW